MEPKETKRTVGVTAVAVALAGLCAAGVPNAISYQGVLLDTGGQPVTGPANLRFRIFRGGDDTTFPSTGALVYHEATSVSPVDGVFSHLIGTGVAQTDCVDGPCVLDAATFSPGTLPVWIEVMLDPDGEAGTTDDDVLLPRTRVGTVGYAYRVASLDGATGGTMSGSLIVDQVTARDGAVVGSNASPTTELRFDASAGSAAVTWESVPAELRFGGRTRHNQGLSLDPSRSVAWGPLPGNGISPHIRFNHWTNLVADGNFDGQPDTRHTLSLCYNCSQGSSAVEVGNEYAMYWLWDMTDSQALGDRRITNRLNFVAPGQPTFAAYLFSLDTNFLGGYANPTAKWAFRTSPARTALSINQNGNVLVGSEAFQPAYPLDVVGGIHTDSDLFLDREKQVRFGGANALTTDATASSLRVGAGFPETRVVSPLWVEQGMNLADGKSMSWGPYTNPVPGTHIRQITTGDTFADGNLDGIADFDHVWAVCYNCEPGGAVPEIAGEYQMAAQWEMTYAPADGTRWIEHNWDFRDPSSNLFRPLAFVLDTDFQGGYADPRAGWTFKTSASKTALHINRNGNVRIGADSPQPAYPLEVSGTLRATGDLRLEGNPSVYFGAERVVSTDAAGALVLGQDRDMVRVGEAASLGLSTCPAVTSATQVTIGECNVVQLGGGNSIHQIDTCDSAHAGRVLHVLCGGANAQLCDSCGNGNLRLAGDMNCTVDDTITLLCDGTVWKELARSVN